jgi:hypothetical protein
MPSLMSIGILTILSSKFRVSTLICEVYFRQSER